MGRFVPCRWDPDLTAFGPRRARIGGTFRAFVPDSLVGRPLSLDARVAADLSDAERVVVELDAGVPRDHRPHRLEVLARLLLRAEAVGSSRVEGLVVSPRRLALTDLDPSRDPSGRALEVVGNIRALEEALAQATAPGPFTVERLLAVHRRLLAGTRDAALGGVVRTEQNWIGGHSPLDADYVPPPPGEVPVLLEDLCAYVSGDDHPPLVQAALAHAQFESIHPFADGNGRTGRALLHLVLRRRGLVRRFVPPVSLVLATWSRRYVDALAATRQEGAPSDPWNAWLELFARAVRMACAQAQAYDERITSLSDRWRADVVARVGRLRADSAAWALLEVLPAAPLVTARAAVTLTGRSPRAVDGALAQLVRAGVLKQVGVGRRNRLFEAVGVFDLVTGAERALAAPTGDTATASPSRAVPRRNRRS
ncbi:MAG: Fic family protein [Deltaproteobacteria bacterium]|nr:Fic family protein [Deltaproteobacteria bacterium]